MWLWFNFFSEMTFEVYFALLGLISAYYFALVGPFLFKFWIIPKIEDRYGVWLRVKDEDYLLPFPNWGMPIWEISTYVICKYFGWDLPGVRKPWKNTLSSKLKQIDYDIKTADRSEIIMSFITLFFFISIIVASFVVLGQKN